MVAENTARLVGKGGRYTKARLTDLMPKPQQEKKPDIGDPKDYAKTLLKKMGLKEHG